MHPVGIGGVEHAVVELGIVVDHRNRQRRRDACGEAVVDLAEQRDVTVLRRVPAPRPAGDLPLGEPVRATQISKADRGRIESVQIGQRIDQREGDAPLDVGVAAHLRRKAPPHDDADAPFHHEKRGADHAGIVAEMKRAGRGPEHRTQRREHRVFARHVMRALRERPERRSTQDHRAVCEAQAIGQVGVAAVELRDGHRPVEAVQMRAQIRLGGRPVQRLAVADLSDIRPCFRMRHGRMGSS